MHRHAVRSAFVIALALTLLGAVTGGVTFRDTVAQDATPTAGTDAIVGSWTINAQGDGFSFVNLTSFLPGGVVINTSDEGPAGHGAWMRTADGIYALTIVAPDFDDDGSLEGLVTVRSAVTLGPDDATFTGSFTTEVTDFSGAVLFTYTGTVDATRIVVEPLPVGSPTP